MLSKKKVLWIAWEKQRRSTVLANELDAELHQLEFNYSRVIRYAVLTAISLKIILVKHYDIIFVQNPSIILSFLMCSIKPFFKSSKVIIDAHTPYLKLNGIKKSIFEWLNRAIFGLSDLVIVTNKDLKEIYEAKYQKGKFYVLPDKIPNLYEPKLKPTHNKIEIFLICTYSKDEPFFETLKAVDGMDNVVLYVSGDKRRISQKEMPIVQENVFLTGFLKEEDYINLLNKVDLVMVLTIQENCMLCGAYEGVSVEKPMILSDKKVLREYFNSGVVFTKNNATDIRKSIQIAIDNYKQLALDIKVLKKQRSAEWKQQWNTLINLLG
jgi:hypothetical protein